MEKDSEIPKIDMRKLDDLDKIMIAVTIVAVILLITIVGILVILKY